ncbi:multiple epidermal growth factor-like domains protein 6 [Mya arenaria]|uniref:multiple epidermal growth factor-like domains protein 6 n=1 Tax=Mya arenaria TaxID=6604 RepID=UPI0022E06D68|nr:multiple epidermal growth factor-like domains protein 6 [Mya arenaria]
MNKYVEDTFYRRLVVVILATLIAGVRGAANGYGIACVSGTDTCSVSGTACIDDGTSTSTKNSKCLCNGDYVANAAVDACVKKFGKTCSADADCLSFGTCSTTCACSIGYVASKDSTKCLGNIGQACTAATDCDSAMGAICDLNAASATCKLEFGTTCSSTSECLSYGTCSTTCVCSIGYVASKDSTKCLGNIGQACTAATDCDTAMGAICDLNAASPTCKLEFGKTCSSTAECLSYGTCSTTCACNTGYVASKDSTKCLGNIGQACTAATDCDTAMGAICDLNAASATCKLEFGKTCSSTAECLSYGTCSTTCACNTGYVASKDSTKCLGNIGQACTAATDCDTAMGAICDLNAASSTCKLVILASIVLIAVSQLGVFLYCL